MYRTCSQIILKRKKFGSNISQSTREKHKQARAYNQIHIYNLCMCTCMHTYVNSTDTNDYPLQQICYQLLDRFYLKSRPIDRLGNNCISTLFPKRVYFGFCMCSFAQCVWLGLFSLFLVSSLMLNGMRVLLYIQTKVTNCTYFICKTCKQNLIVLPIVRASSLIHVW